jgi:hypothetical protein
VTGERYHPDVNGSEIPGDDLSIRMRLDLGMHGVKELPDGSWEWIYRGRSNKGDRYNLSDRFMKSMHAYFMGEEWRVALARKSHGHRQPTELDLIDYLNQRSQYGERLG